MTERTALISGGARGIGRDIAESLARDGWRVAVCYRSEATAATATALEQTLRTQAPDALARQCDVSQPVACAALVAEVMTRWGRIDALIHGAGPYHRRHLLDEETLEGWHEMFDHNLHPVFHLSRLVAPHMQAQRWGRILTFAMANADRMAAQPFVTGHYIAKAGVLILTRTLAKLLAPHGITVNAISPGFIDSGSAPVEELMPMVKTIPAGYLGELRDTTAAARFLLSDEARYVNGANLQVGGGWGI